MKRIVLIQVGVLLILCFSFFCVGSYALEEQVEWDKDNSKKTSYWTNIPLVSQELRDKGISGGAGGQWPLVLATSSDGEIMFYGTDVGGLFRSTDYGKTWDKSMKDFSAFGASDIVVDPHNKKRVVVFGVNADARYTTGIHVSHDSGESWKFVQSFKIRGYRDTSENLAFDPTSYNEELGYTTDLYLSLIYKKDGDKSELELVDEVSESYTDGVNPCNKAGLYKSVDGGNTWNMINNTLYDGIVKVSPTTGYVYVAKTDGLYVSKNKGESFIQLNSEYILGLDIVKDTVYYTTNTGLYFSTDGVNFTLQKNTGINGTTAGLFPVKENYRPMNLKVSPVNPKRMVFFFGNVSHAVYHEGEVYWTEDGGKNWWKGSYNASDNFLHYIQERVANFVWSPVEEKKVWNFTSDCISSSLDGGNKWKWDSNGITNTHIGGTWHFNVYDPDLIYFGAQDYNGFSTLDGGYTWKYIDMATYSNEHGYQNWKYNGHVYGGYAASSLTYFGGVATNWGDTKYLTITHDGGQTHTAYVGDENYALSSGYKERLNGQNYFSSYQSPTNPNILFCGDLRSIDGGYTWNRMLDESGNVAITGVYTHDQKTGRLFGINDYHGEVVYSDDEGVTWKKYNQISLDPYQESPFISSLSYDSLNDKLYVAWGWVQLSVISDGGKVVKEISKKLPKAFLNNSALRTNLGSLYYERRILAVAVDPNYPSIVYAGGSSYGYRSDTDLYRSLDGGETWDVVSINGTNSIISLDNSEYGGIAPISMNVHPKTGELWVASSNGGFSKLTPPYKTTKMNQIRVHYYVKDTEIKVKEDAIMNVLVGDTYQIKAPEIDGYILTSISEFKGVMTEEEFVISFYYQAKDGKVPEQVDKPGEISKPDEIENPETGENVLWKKGLIIIGGLFVLFLTLDIFLFKKKYLFHKLK